MYRTVNNLVQFFLLVISTGHEGRILTLMDQRSILTRIQWSPPELVNIVIQKMEHAAKVVNVRLCSLWKRNLHWQRIPPNGIRIVFRL